MIRVSVAMATYNGAAFLEAQLASLAAQTRPPDELVIGDDGSSDETLAILGRFAATAPFPVRVTRNPARLGVAANFFATIARCAGEVILPCDQDDLWHPDKIARLTQWLAANPGKLLVTHDAAIVDGDGRATGLTMGGQIAAAGGDPARDLVAGCCMALDARLARAFVPVPATATHDAWAAQLADLLGVRGHLEAALIDYRRHGANVSQSYMSRTGRTSRLARFADRAAKARAQPVQDSLAAALAANESLRAAVAAHGEALADGARAAAALAVVACRIDRDRRRIAIHQGRGTARIGALAAAWRAGDYRGADGALSLLRDLAG